MEEAEVVVPSHDCHAAFLNPVTDLNRQANNREMSTWHGQNPHPCQS